ncbi:MAG: hypothetical protein R6X25_07590, partial [Candidatus Krumholzibacteriia bacterium]
KLTHRADGCQQPPAGGPPASVGARAERGTVRVRLTPRRPLRILPVNPNPEGGTMAANLDVLLLLALPASGKSEVRRYLATLSPDTCRDEFGIGPTTQLDDFPYVHLMRRISDEVTVRGQEGPFFLSPALPFREPRDWGTLIELLNEDHVDLTRPPAPEPESAARWLFARLDAARARVGACPAVSRLDPGLRLEVAAALEDECRALWNDRRGVAPGYGTQEAVENRTVLLEFARGGADGSPLPLPAPYGYRYSLGCLDHDILARAAILYVWVTPEESRRKNTERADPDDPGSILHHGVPRAVMYGDYGCDDFNWLLEQSDVPDTVRVEKDGRSYHLPVGRFDNRADLTTFVREDQERWSPEHVQALHGGLREAFTALQRARGR